MSLFRTPASALLPYVRAIARRKETDIMKSISTDNFHLNNFKPNRAFRKRYDSIFKKDPLAANMLLLLAELADGEGKVRMPNPPEEAIILLMAERFEDPRGYQL